MFIRKKDYEAMIRKHEEEINDYIWKMAEYKVDAETARRGIRHALCYLTKVKDNECVATAIERLRSYYIVSHGDPECFDEILNSD